MKRNTYPYISRIKTLIVINTLLPIKETPNVNLRGNTIRLASHKDQNNKDMLCLDLP